MDFEAYQQLSARTLKRGHTTAHALADYGLGLAGEAGEVVEHIKHHVFHGEPLDHAALSVEIGDVLWYLAALASVAGLSLEQIAAGNVAKLRQRYPDGFSAEASLARRAAVAADDEHDAQAEEEVSE